jgi:hypothetical protein
LNDVFTYKKRISRVVSTDECQEATHGLAKLIQSLMKLLAAEKNDKSWLLRHSHSLGVARSIVDVAVVSSVPSIQFLIQTIKPREDIDISETVNDVWP